MNLGLTRSPALTPFGPNEIRNWSGLMGTGGTSSLTGTDPLAATGMLEGQQSAGGRSTSGCEGFVWRGRGSQ